MNEEPVPTIVAGKNSSFKTSLFDFAKTFIKIVLIVAFLRLFMIQPFYVRGSSMEPSFHEAEYLIIEKIGYVAGQPRRGDVVIFHYPNQNHSCARVRGFLERTLQEAIGFFEPGVSKCVNFIKRIIGLPGETVELRDGKVFVVNQSHPEGFELSESYIEPGTQTLSFSGDERFEVPRGEYFVLGDNRYPGGSSDSRDWGYLPKRLMLGKVFFKVYPLHEFGFNRRPVYPTT